MPAQAERVDAAAVTGSGRKLRIGWRAFHEWPAHQCGGRGKPAIRQAGQLDAADFTVRRHARHDGRPRCAGKTSLLRTLSRLVAARSGTVLFDGRDLTNAAPDAVLQAGIAHVPEGRRLFKGLTVRDNLLLGAYLGI